MFKRTLTTLCLAVVMTLAVTLPAMAHAHLDTAKPAPDSTISTSPSQLALTFTEGLNLAFSSARITGPDNAEVATGDEQLKSGDDKVLIVPLDKTLANGTYTVNWKALSRDGHSTHGSYQFTVE